MLVTIRCPFCAKALRLDDSKVGRKVRCSYCPEMFIAEADLEEEDPRPPARRPSIRLPAVDQPLIPKVSRPRDRDRPTPVWKRELMSAVLYFAVIGGFCLLVAVGVGVAVWYTSSLSPVPPLAPPTAKPVAQQGTEVDRLLGDLVSINPAQRIAAADRLCALDPNVPRREEVARALANCLKDSNPQSAIGAAIALETWATPTVVPQLQDALSHESQVVCKSSLRALGWLKDERSPVFLAKALTTSERTDAENALQAFGSQAESAVIPYLADASPMVRSAACRVLARIGTARSLTAVQQVVDRDTDLLVKRTAEAAVRAIQNRKP